jgi:hypothetical protein
MDKQEVKINNQATEQEPTPRPWVTPTFERTDLKEALSSITGYANDGPFYRS